MATEGLRVALALGSGGARGYAHIGVIEVLEERGFTITGVAGSSMGALVGGLYAAGELDAYTKWARDLSQRDVLRLLDVTLTGPGLVRADKALDVVTELVGETAIEDLSIPFTAVATDLAARKEVWFQRGRLDAAIRASIAIPGIITPVVMDGRLLADGGLLDPVPVVPTAAIPADVTVGVSLSEEHVTTGGMPADPTAAEATSDPSAQPEATAGDPDDAAESELIRTVTNWLSGLRGQVLDDAGTEQPTQDDAAQLFGALPSELGTRDVIDLALDTLRGLVAKYRLAGYPPDVLITIPREACGTLDFHRADEMIELGRERAEEALG
jgi:NTE family protein